MVKCPHMITPVLRQNDGPARQGGERASHGKSGSDGVGRQGEKGKGREIFRWHEAACQPASNQRVKLIFKQRGHGGTEGQIVAGFIRGAAERIGRELQTRSNVKNIRVDSEVSPRHIATPVRSFSERELAAPVPRVKEITTGSSPDPVNGNKGRILTHTR